MLIISMAASEACSTAFDSFNLKFASFDNSRYLLSKAFRLSLIFKSETNFRWRLERRTGFSCTQAAIED